MSRPAPEPALVCETPARSSRYVHNVLEVGGWTRGATRLEVSFAGARHEVPLAPETAGDRRRRFALRVAVEKTARGEQRLEIVAETDDGAKLREERALVAEPYGDPHPPSDEALGRGEVTIATDPPDLAGGEVTVPARVGGWCYAEAGIDRVRAVLDGAREYDLVFPLVRRDVWRAVGRSDALLSGFGLVLDREQCPPGRHSLVVLVTAADGRTVGQAGAFTCVDAPDAGAVGLPHLDTSASDIPSASAAPPALGPLLAAVDRGWALWAAPLATGRAVLVLSGEPSQAALAPLRETAASLIVVDDEAGLAACSDGCAELVVVASALAVDDRSLRRLERVLTPDGMLLAVGDSPTGAGLRARFEHMVEWTQTAQLNTAFVPAQGLAAGRAVVLAGRRPLPALTPAPPETIPVDLAALAEEHELERLAAVVAERHVLVSTLEGNVIALYDQQLQRTAGELRAQLARRDAEVAALQTRASAAETELRALRRTRPPSASAPLSALRRVVRGRHR